jgi:UDP-N-acetylmuramoyl-tripeptide--D-alanyl-D-alanine ligase
MASATIQSHVQLSFEKAAEVTAGELRLADGVTAKQTFSGLQTDSRQVEKGQAFLALVGERHDAHRFVDDVVERGAALLIVSQSRDDVATSQLVVEDTLAALTAIARAWRRHVGPRVVAITGSLGKTTTKELCYQLLSQLGKTHRTPGNFNNHVGVPLTLLSMPADCRYLVAELGMNAPGEIAELAKIVEPELGIITAIAPVHLEGLGSLEAIAGAKAELLSVLDERHSAIVPAGAPHLDEHLATCKAKVLRFGSLKDERADGPKTRPDVALFEHTPLGAAGSRIVLRFSSPNAGNEANARLVNADLPLFGHHNALNAAAAGAMAWVFGLDDAQIAAGLQQAPELGHRSAIVEHDDYRIIDDCYNSSPIAAQAALTALVDLAGDAPRAALLGTMLELGDDAEALHEALGRDAYKAGLSLLISAGPFSEATARGALLAGMNPSRVFWQKDAKGAGMLATRTLPKHAWVLVKGSRGAQMEQAIEALNEGRGRVLQVGGR